MKRTIITLMALAGIAVADTIVLTMPPTANNGGHGSVSNPVSGFAGYETGGYYFNNGGAVGTNEETGEGILTTSDELTSLTMCPRKGAGGSGMAIVLSGTDELAKHAVSSLTFNIVGSYSAAVTGDVSLTLAVVKSTVENTVATWSVVQSAEGSLTIGSGSSVELELTNSINWSDSYKVIAVVDNLGKNLNGGNGDAYTMTGISVTAEAELIPEPTTATLSLLALAGLAVRRRRK